MAGLTVYPTIDSHILGLPEEGKNNNYGSLTSVIYGVGFIGGEKSTWRRAIGNFDVSAVSGRTINSAKLVRNVHTIEGGGAGGRVARCTRPADWVEAEVTWIDYKSANAWTDEGGDFDDVTPTKVDYTEPSATGEHEVTGLAAFVTDALDNRSGIVSIIIRLQDEGPASGEVYQWYSKDNAVGHDAWRLVVDHSGAPIGAQRERGFLRGVARGVVRGGA